jgi:large subunit ribosomal protein L3
MPKGLLGKKIGMTQVYDETGTAVPVTVIEAGPCVVLQIRRPELDGYAAVQLGFDDKPRRLAIRSERGHLAQIGSRRQKARQAAGVEIPPKAECEPKRFVREFRADGEKLEIQVGDETRELKVGDSLNVSVFKDIQFVDVTGTTKGRGYAGAIKRHNFSGLCASHGVKKVHRSLGSTGQRQDPGRVFKGQKMPGHYGHERVTVRHLKVVRIDEANNMLLIRGAVPGHNGSYVMIRETNRK